METEIPDQATRTSAMIRDSSVDPGRTSHGSGCGIVVPVDTAEKRLAETRRVLEKLKTNTATREEKDRLNILLAQMETEIPDQATRTSAMIRDSSVDPGRTSHGSGCGIVVPVDTAEKRLAE